MRLFLANCTLPKLLFDVTIHKHSTMCSIVWEQKINFLWCFCTLTLVVRGLVLKVNWKNVLLLQLIQKKNLVNSFKQQVFGTLTRKNTQTKIIDLNPFIFHLKRNIFITDNVTIWNEVIPKIERYRYITSPAIRNSRNLCLSARPHHAKLSLCVLGTLRFSVIRSFAAILRPPEPRPFIGWSLSLKLSRRWFFCFIKYILTYFFVNFHTK